VEVGLARNPGEWLSEHSLQFSWNCQMRELHKDNQDSLGIKLVFLWECSPDRHLGCCQDQDFLVGTPQERESEEDVASSTQHIANGKASQEHTRCVKHGHSKNPSARLQCTHMEPSCESRLMINCWKVGHTAGEGQNKRADWGADWTTRYKSLLSTLSFVHVNSSLSQS
jgi:hypothetical protein